MDNIEDLFKKTADDVRIKKGSELERSELDQLKSYLYAAIATGESNE